MKTQQVIQKVSFHLMGMCECCGQYRLLEWTDIELGHICKDCVGIVYDADSALYLNTRGISRPTKGGTEWEK